VTISYSGGRVTSSAGNRVQVPKGQTVRGAAEVGGPAPFPPDDLGTPPPP
jgi:hypothetical protein